MKRPESNTSPQSSQERDLIEPEGMSDRARARWNKLMARTRRMPELEDEIRAKSRRLEDMQELVHDLAVPVEVRRLIAAKLDLPWPNAKPIKELQEEFIAAANTLARIANEIETAVWLREFDGEATPQ
ncbi:hypothetical protein [uncultured Pseudacidovorax sp.]|uniref:hypothetical protein n=1 Tax=uncultured Pseudacidovorax sp. TaxID=679313 RepID=UPI0025FA3550|nr:hypothetical protein [uncultured Pseudacidovorax sp.]